MLRDDLARRPRHSAWLRPGAMLSVAVMVAGVGVGVGTTPSFRAAALTRTANVKSAHARSGFLACEVTDTGGINDRFINAFVYEGLKVAAFEVRGLKYTFLSSSSTSDYTPNINTFIGERCGIIVTVGFDMADATQTAAEANPTQKFSIVDFEYTPALNNVLALVYETNQDAFLGGYLAAAMSKTGVVGTFGGQDVPTVTIYMDGWVAGVRYYDQLNSAHVVALGWIRPRPRFADGTFQGSGLFTNSFTSQALGVTPPETLMAEGANVIFPVAGQADLGAAAAVEQAGAGHHMEWVDVDGCVQVPQYCSLFITSVTKNYVSSVATAVKRRPTGPSRVATTWAPSPTTGSPSRRSTTSTARSLGR